VASTRRYALRASQLARIRAHHAFLSEVVSLAELNPHKEWTVDNAQLNGAILIAGDPTKPATTRWLPVPSRQSAAMAAKVREAQGRILTRYGQLGLHIASHDVWRYRETIMFGPVRGRFEVKLDAPTQAPSARVLRSLLLKGSQMAKKEAARFQPVLSMCFSAIDRLESRHPGKFQREAAYAVLSIPMSNRNRTPEEVERTMRNYAERFVDSMWKAQAVVQEDSSCAELQISCVPADHNNLVVSLVMTVPGFKPRVTFRTTKTPLPQTVSEFLRGYGARLKTLPLIVRAEQSLHGLLASIEEIDVERLRLPLANSYCADAAQRYRAVWENSVPEMTRRLNRPAARKSTKARRPGKVTVFTDASLLRETGGIVSVLIGLESQKPIVVSAPTAAGPIHILEARAVVMGLETLGTYAPASQARILTDNQSVAHAFRLCRETGFMRPVIQKAAGNRSAEWLIGMLEQHQVGWVKGHANIQGNVLADQAASQARTSSAPAWA
jgi:ribonuclease HI